MTLDPFHMIDDHGNAGIGAVMGVKLGPCDACGRANKVVAPWPEPEKRACVTGCRDQFIPPPVARGTLPLGSIWTTNHGRRRPQMMYGKPVAP